MLDECKKMINKIKMEYALDAPDNVIMSIVHIMNTFSLDLAQASAQSGPHGNYGFDAWHMESDRHKLIFYKSCLSAYPAQVAGGLDAMRKAYGLAEDAILSDKNDSAQFHDPCLYNLSQTLATKRKGIRKIQFEVVSPYRKEELENYPSVDDFEEFLKQSKLNRTKSMQLAIEFRQYNLDAVVAKTKGYSLKKLGTPRISIDRHTYLDFTLTPLFDLVGFYRQRGDMLFDKNVRLSLKNFKRSKDRLVTPMENTLVKICDGDLPVEMFTFYHGGVTIAVHNMEDGGRGGRAVFDTPSVINGCQTITIANEFLKKIEKAQDAKKLERFKDIKVVAKIVVGATEEDLREVTNANNRHNAIDNWQLYSNTPVHIAIELTLRSKGVFYERQEGKFDALHEQKSFQEQYPNTNKTYISVQQLGQIIALCKRHLNWAAKKSEIFTRTENHDKIFDSSVPRRPEDVIFVFNLYKAMDRAIEKYLQKPAYQADLVSGIFRRPMVQAHINYIGCLFYYQKDSKKKFRKAFFAVLYKRAHPDLVAEVEGSYLFRVMSRIKDWYVKEYGSPKQTDDKLVEINLNRLKEFMDKLAEELGVDLSGNIPFINGIDWSPYYGADELQPIEDLIPV